MIPKEKAKELANKFLGTGMMIRQAKECALICVDEMISTLNELDSNLITYQVKWQKIYLKEVKQEINKL